jgi:S-adenosylmethionine hydrolase
VSAARPILTFLTDFGLSDPYVAEMKAAVLGRLPEATLIDITHLIPPQDVLAGAIALERAVRAFPMGTVHVAVVDPGVGSARKLLLCKVAGQMVLAPDNGLITWVLERNDAAELYELLWRPSTPPSNTFHGRDIFAPAASLIAAGRCDELAKRPASDPVTLDAKLARSLKVARIVHIDHYGNATTNVPAELLTPGTRVAKVGPVLRTYADVKPGKAVALVGSSGLLEIAVRDGSAAKVLKLRVGKSVTIVGGGR